MQLARRHEKSLCAFVTSCFRGLHFAIQKTRLSIASCTRNSPPRRCCRSPNRRPPADTDRAAAYDSRPRSPPATPGSAPAALPAPPIDRARRAQSNVPVPSPPTQCVMPGTMNRRYDCWTLRGPAAPGHHAVVVVHAVGRRDRLIAPAVVLQQLAAAPEEGRQIRIDGVHHAVVRLLGPRDVAIEIERLVVPRRHL